MKTSPQDSEALCLTSPCPLYSLNLEGLLPESLFWWGNISALQQLQVSSLMILKLLSPSFLAEAKQSSASHQEQEPHHKKRDGQRDDFEGRLQ